MTEIAELEVRAQSYIPKVVWTDDEIDTLQRYYKKVPIKDLMRYLPGRTHGAIRVEVCELKNKGLWKEVKQ
jgi:hypothetical protein